MTHLCCPGCRLRFTPAARAYLAACPKCGEQPQFSSLEGTVGFRIFRLEDVPDSLPEAAVVSLPVPEPGGARP
jgi:hypothetical protein